MKPLIVVSCPIDTFSGYGGRSRDLVLPIIKSGKYDVKILAQRWGNTSWGFLDKNIPDHKLIKDCILKTAQLPKQPDCWIQITVPNEFQPIGKFNIGATAGIETTVCDPSWIDGLNRMNLNLVSSNFTKKVFEDCKFEEKNSQTNETVRKIELISPIEVLFEGVNTEIFKKLDKVEGELNDVINDLIPEDFCFLYVGHWLQGDLGQDRKDTGMLLKTFLETFKDKKQKPALIMKTSSATYSVMDREEMLDKIRIIQESVGNNLPNVYLLHGELEDEQMNELYNHPKVKALATFTKGEGYGRPLLEATLSQKPVIASNWSGHVDFLDSEMSILLSGELTNVHPSAAVANMITTESKWFTVDYKKAKEVLEDVFKNYKKYTDGAKRQAFRSRTEFNLEKMSEKILDVLEKNIPKPVELKLPQLKKIELPKFKKVD